MMAALVDVWPRVETLAWLPVAAVQGYRLRRDTPVLPEATGPRSGAVGKGPMLRLTTLGDSTIAGVGVDHIRDTVTSVLARRLARSHSVVWRAIGKSGATARSAREQLVPRLAGQGCDVLILSVGVNDVLRGNTSRGFARDVSALVQAAREHVGDAAVILSGLPPLDHFPLLPRALRRVAGHRARALDASLSRVALRSSRVVHHPLRFRTTDASAFAEDGFHPGLLAHEMWAEQLVPVVSAVRRGP